MARSAKTSRKDSKQRPFRPLLLAAGLGLLWFVEFQDSAIIDDMPSWSAGAVLGARLFADFVGAWLLVSLLRLAVAAGKLGVTWLRSLLPQGTL